MKKQLLVLCLFFLGAVGYAQSTLHPSRLGYYRDLEPRNTMTYDDFSGQEWDIHSDLLDQGKTVYYMYAGSGAGGFVYQIINNGMMEFYNLHGPNGDNTIEFIIFAGQEDETLLSNPFPGNDTLPFLFFDINSSNDFQWSARKFGSLTRICPDRSFHQLLLYYELQNLDPDSIPYPTLEELEADLASCEKATDNLDVAILWSNTIERPNLEGQTRPVDVFLSNMGTETLTSATIEVWWADSLQSTTEWEGSLATYAYDTIYLPDAVTNGTTDSFKFVVKNPNGGIDEDASNNFFYTPSEKGSPTLMGEIVVVKVTKGTSAASVPNWDIIGSDGIKYGGWYHFENWLTQYAQYFPAFGGGGGYYEDSVYSSPSGWTVRYDTVVLPSTVDYFTFRGFSNQHNAYNEMNNEIIDTKVEIFVNDTLVFNVDNFFYEKCFVARTPHSPYFFPDTSTVPEDTIVVVPLPEDTIVVVPEPDVIENLDGISIKEVPEVVSASEDKIWKQSWSLYPNPAKNTVSIVSSQSYAVSMQVFDPLGRSVYGSEFKGQVTFSVIGWPPGVYFVQLLGANGLQHYLSLKVLY